MNYFTLLLEEHGTKRRLTQAYASHSQNIKVVKENAQKAICKHKVHHVLPLFTKLNNN